MQVFGWRLCYLDKTIQKICIYFPLELSVLIFWFIVSTKKDISTQLFNRVWHH